VGRKEGALVRSIIEGLTWKEAARRAGLEEDRARRFLESVERFAAAVGSPMEFAASEAPVGERSGGDGASGPGPFPELVVHTDGASLGNPGPSGAGGVILTPDGSVVGEFHEHIGHATSNVAEYEAVRIGLTRALALGARRIVVRLDSELVANQLAGRYRVKDPKLVAAYLRVEPLLSQLDDVTFEPIPRGDNRRADALAQMGARRGPP
jgi:ribonuclease HI